MLESPNEGMSVSPRGSEAEGNEPVSRASPISRDPKTGLLIVRCKPNSPITRMTLEEILEMQKAIINGEDLDDEDAPA